MDLHVAIRVEEHAIFCSVRPTVRPPDDMGVMPARQLGNRLVAGWTDTALRFPKGEELSPPLEVVYHVHAKAVFKVEFPRRVVRIGRAFNLRVTLYRHLRCVEQLDLLGAPLFIQPLAAKDPVAPTDGMEVGV